ncbi:FIG00870880: hypothetical protein [uncultured Coleofasciculus sp.]|uniref:Uncharacterized protein n=1 Tax=uncultured Coleofasciculus sp. TaxID=1267456 RepID=A0A6J4HAC1_9CYAN|nr:FIG00870880: hypothetical protein [uncultured Coleofasciculus sp.]
MRSQWDCLLQNIGEWQGSFTRFSPRGEQLQDTPTVVSFETLNDHKTMRQTIRRLPPNQPVDEKVLEYSSLGRNILFLENGAFSLGSIQWGPFSEFGAELGLIEGNRRLRLVQMFDRTSQFERLTLIRERLAGTDTPERPPLTVEQLLGEWHGEAVTVYPDFRTSDTYPTVLKIHQENSDRLVQQLTFGAANSVRTIASTAKIDGSILSFDQSALPTQVLLLPDGASSNCPLQIKPGHFFILEVGWLLQPNKRQRLVRTYNDKGEWINLTLVSEEKVVG